RSPSPSAPSTLPSPSRPSGKKTLISSPCRLWALVSTLPASTTTPEPPRQRLPRPTVDRPAPSAMPLIALPRSSIGPMGPSSISLRCACARMVVCDLHAATYDSSAGCEGRRDRGPTTPAWPPPHHPSLPPYSGGGTDGA